MPHAVARTRGTILFTITKRVTFSRSFAPCEFLLDKVETLQPVRKDFALYCGVCAIFLHAGEPELCYGGEYLLSEVFFKVYSENVHRIAHHTHRCIRHSIIYMTVYMNCLDGNHERGAMSFNEHNIVRFGHLLWTTRFHKTHGLQIGRLCENSSLPSITF